MANQKYAAMVTSVGELAVEFMAEGIVVFFSKAAPEELQEHSVVHDNVAGQDEDVRVGDTVRIGSGEFPILAVGSVANENLRNLGHLVLKFNGMSEPEMQGDVTLPVADIPPIGPGTELTIYGE